ncbi:MAG TPA: hypothetical protein VEX64_07510 [Pyrinomonadaceae bacterium]|jgi:hypothetical protein|nr:hypothetical protein [Pyrinomonadaceae bacterium]
MIKSRRLASSPIFTEREPKVQKTINNQPPTVNYKQKAAEAIAVKPLPPFGVYSILTTVSVSPSSKSAVTFGTAGKTLRKKQLTTNETTRR